MYKIAWVLIFILLITGCGPANVQEVQIEIRKTGHAIEQQSWREASENLKTLEDWWHYVTNKYKKKDRDRFDQLIHELDLSVTSRDSKKSKELWKKLKENWNQMNYPNEQLK